MIETTARRRFDAPAALQGIVDEMRVMAVGALARMYVPDRRMFCHCVRRGPQGDVPEGISRRYTAIVLIGLAAGERSWDDRIFQGASSESVCDGLLADVNQVDNLGDVALTLWAAAALQHDSADRALKRLRELDAVRGDHPTVEVAWALSALSVHPGFLTDTALRGAIAGRLLASFNSDSGLFPHWPTGAKPSTWRRHVTCFADWVYPVQALAYHHLVCGDGGSLDAAKRSTETMLRLQGPAGQWWWHYDVRTGKVIERYPVYSVHQDGMAPMALFAVQDAAGQDAARQDATRQGATARGAGEAVRRGLQWLITSPERGDSLIDRDAGLIWRKVCRREPSKLSRALQAAASRLHPSLRTPGVNLMFPPVAVDYECRPYHMGWLLYAFSDQRLAWSSGGIEHSGERKRTTGRPADAATV